MDILTAVFGVFTDVGEWMVTTIPELLTLFWSPTDGLTILGVLAVCSLAISVIFLLIGLIQRFLDFRG